MRRRNWLWRSLHHKQAFQMDPVSTMALVSKKPEASSSTKLYFASQ